MSDIHDVFHVLMLKKYLRDKEQQRVFDAPDLEIQADLTTIETPVHILAREDKIHGNKEGVGVDPLKINAIVEWPIPKTLKGLRGFLGLAGYYRKFIKGFGVIAQPLTNLLKKGAFKWSTGAEDAFNSLKQALTQPPVLTMPDFSMTFVIECDACDSGIGAVLMQNERPIVCH
ncbi:uncharacterized protein LOC109821688 [Asparagus officinalis]|uniref:uncharacterized protein LOC109821688 n=1 Tax=Asparagus officinalis TaxID=4686 RepID=UPI00098E6BC6|nr:uncharacterized protein LOC109821688 [Asparagus officinalis]